MRTNISLVPTRAEAHNEKGELDVLLTTMLQTEDGVSAPYECIAAGAQPTALRLCNWPSLCQPCLPCIASEYDGAMA